MSEYDLVGEAEIGIKRFALPGSVGMHNWRLPTKKHTQFVGRAADICRRLMSCKDEKLEIGTIARFDEASPE